MTTCFYAVYLQYGIYARLDRTRIGDARHHDCLYEVSTPHITQVEDASLSPVFGDVPLEDGGGVPDFHTSPQTAKPPLRQTIRARNDPHRCEEPL
jgi:hypothetical protein